MPIVNGMLLSSPELIGPPLDATDAGPLVNGTRERSIWDRANWVILASCPEAGNPIPPGTTPKALVLKASEMSTQERRKASKSEYQFLIGC